MADCRTRHDIKADWFSIAEPDRLAILAWMERNGIPASGQARWAELTGEGAVTVELLVRNADGSMLRAGDDVATVVRTFPVSEPPPPCWFNPTFDRP